ncbi:MAG: DNA primase DnaG [Candidatus Nanoarchaeia archaeon]|nr:DNA primase DnaG [Candidatus Nanoarchaeia archaeon]
MGKISPVSAKYIVHANIQIEGTVDRPDVVGAIFGQTEGLLGENLELRELQRSGRIGRIEVKTDIKAGKTSGNIIIPSSLDKAETAIIAAALETIERIGPCNSKVNVEKIEDVRISKRSFVIERAKELLKNLTSDILPDSQEITDEVAKSVRMMESIEYGKDRLAAGPAIEESDEVIVVEGRADVLNLLRHGIKNAIAMNGTNVPETIIELCGKKTVTVFVDGDRGGDLIIKEISAVAEIDYVAKAPDGKEVEEITKKEIHKALRSRVAIEQILEDLKSGATLRDNGRSRLATRTERPMERNLERPRVQTQLRSAPVRTYSKVPDELKETFKVMVSDMIGTRGASILDDNKEILGKVPITELSTTLRNLKAFAVVMDGEVDRELAKVAERAGVRFIVGTLNKVRPGETKVIVVTDKEI